MTEFLMKLLGFVVRLGLILAGLVFFASLLAAALLVLLVWLLRALWARLTGQPVQPWTFQVNRPAMWQRFYRGESSRAAGDDVVDVESVDVKNADVTDVEPKRIDPPRH